MIYCANCFHMKVKRGLCSNKKYIIPRTYCKLGLLTRAETERGWVHIATVHRVHPPNPHSCLDYQSMGDGIEEFLAELPIDKSDAKNGGW